jgi:hypothetical protein
MREKKARMFEEISVWRRVGDATLLQYRCLRGLDDGRYFVKCSHFYREPINREQIHQAQFYFLDGMFGDALIEIPKESYETLEEAIAAHDEDFGDSFK